VDKAVDYLPSEHESLNSNPGMAESLRKTQLPYLRNLQADIMD
jgi:hypothetical protein